jgi:HEAT repeat protein
MRQLRDVKGADRAWAAWCLYQLGLEIKDKERVLRTREVALDALIRLMKDEDSETSGVTTMRLCLVAGPKAARAVPALVERMAASPDHREYILNALGRIGPAAAKAAPAIRKLLGAETARVREEAALALARVKPDDPETLKALLRMKDLPVAALGELGPRARAAVPLIVRRLRTYDRFEAADALWKIDPPTARKLGAW